MQYKLVTREGKTLYGAESGYCIQAAGTPGKYSKFRGTRRNDGSFCIKVDSVNGFGWSVYVSKEHFVNWYVKQAWVGEEGTSNWARDVDQWYVVHREEDYYTIHVGPTSTKPLYQLYLSGHHENGWYVKACPYDPANLNNYNFQFKLEAC